jgi:hypothetical protein
LAAVLVSGGVFYGLVYLLDFQAIGTPAKLDAKTLFELVKLSFGVVAGAGALVALVVAYRRQRADEAGAHREATRLHTERFSQAVDKLGSDSPAVRLGGVHALTGLADDAPGGLTDPGRAATSTSPASSSTAAWTSTVRRSPAAQCPSPTRPASCASAISCVGPCPVGAVGVDHGMKKSPSRIIAITALTAGAALASMTPAQAGVIDGALNNVAALQSVNTLGSLVNSALSDASNNNANTKADGKANYNINH